MNAPVVVFAFKRIDTLKLAIEALGDNQLSIETNLIIFSDGPRNEGDTKAVRIVREYLRLIKGFKSVTIFEREQNYGLANNIVQGLSVVLEKHEMAIVLEDDIIVAPFFLEYMNDVLNLYRNDEKVCQVTGYSYLEKYKEEFDLPETYFIKGGDCLAWGTWRRAWIHYNHDAEAFANQILKSDLIRKFNRDNSYNFYKMLRNTIAGKTSSWAIKWYAVNFLADRYTLYPLRSLARHIGADSDATNFGYVGAKDPYDVQLYDSRTKVERIEISERPNVGKAYNMFLNKTRGSVVERARHLIGNKIKRALWHS